MSNSQGVVARGIKAPIIRSGDDIVKIVVSSLESATKENDFKLNDGDVIGITESVVARAQNNYVSIDHIATDIKDKFETGEFAIIFPILSRNRFSICLKGIAKGAKKIYLMLSYPSDEVGNSLMSDEKFYNSKLNSHSDVLSLNMYRKIFGFETHEFTGVDYIEYYKSIVEEAGASCELVFCSEPTAILSYTKNVLCADIHTRFRTMDILKNMGAQLIFSLDDVLNKSINGSGCNKKYGLLGSNKASEDTLKLFPDDCQDIVEAIQIEIKKIFNVNAEVMVYGDGAFKDPVGKIWELADPVVSPAFTQGLIGTPNELKIKYLADNKFANLKGEELTKAIEEQIKSKSKDLKGKMEAEGTTPRHFTDLLGSLCDLVSGSGDKGTPIVLVQNYFKNYSDS